VSTKLSRTLRQSASYAFPTLLSNLVKGIDLLVGGLVLLSAVVGMMLINAGLPAVILPMIFVALGILLGFGNGILGSELTIKI
jgi:ribose/xylose/arabinose/galactoside ABC-type transport system permease subunit